MPPTDEDQAFFNTWDFISMHTLKVELGVSSEMEVHDRNFKASKMGRRISLRYSMQDRIFRGCFGASWVGGADQTAAKTSIVVYYMDPPCIYYDRAPEIR